MNVRDSSCIAYASTAPERALIRARIVGLLINQGEMTRRQIAHQLGLETSCVAGRVNELLSTGAITESEEIRPCPITGKRVHWISASPRIEQQMAKVA